MGGVTVTNAGTLTVGSISIREIVNSGTIQLGNAGSISITSPGPALDAGTFDLSSGSLILGQPGTLNSTTADLINYPLAAGTDITTLANNAILLSGGSFGQAGMLLLNTGSLMLEDASVAPDFAQLNQSSGLVGTVLVPEPVIAGIALLSMTVLLRRHRRRSHIFAVIYVAIVVGLGILSPSSRIPSR